MNTITPFLWFDDNAEEAVAFYTSVFSYEPGSKIGNTVRYSKDSANASGRPKGSVMTVPFELAGQKFTALNGGPVFKFNPSISFIVNFDPSKDKNARKHLDSAWERLSEGGTALMPLDKYPFSERFGWIQDKYGLTWQLILTNPDGEDRPFIVPSLLFTGNVCGKAEEASNYYLSVFSRDNSLSGNVKRGSIIRYPGGMEPEKEGTVMFTDFMINNLWVSAMDSARDHKFNFNEAVSFVVNCETQEEIDYYWEKLSAVPESEQCGWLKDRFGVSWQIVPNALGTFLNDPGKAQRVMQAILQMKKIDIAELKRAYEVKNH